MEKIVQDERFSSVAFDPRFKPIPQHTRKVKIDKRFKEMFQNEHFHLNTFIDKRGRAVALSGTKDLHKYYLLSSDDDEFSDANSDVQKEFSSQSRRKLLILKKDKFELNDNLNESLLDEDTSSELCSDDDDEDESDFSISQEFEHPWGELDNDAERGEISTARLAVCNMDWDRIKARDLMMVFKSFVGQTGVVYSVKVNILNKLQQTRNFLKIFPSDFGLKRMAEEEQCGPVELYVHNENSNSDNETEEGREYHREKLRKYQMNRLKYYYAVVEFDSVETATCVYKECDGVEFESSANKFDLRFIPDDITFDDKKCKDQCNNIDDPEFYTPKIFVNTALQQMKVDLTWDETDPDRVDAIKKAFDKKENFDNDMYKAYVASESDSEKEENDYKIPSNEKDRIDMYRKILLDIKEEEEKKNHKDIELEITWEPALQDKAKEVIKEKQNKELSAWEKYKNNIKEKRKNKHCMNKLMKGEINDTNNQTEEASLELLIMNENDDKHHFNLKDLLTKNKQKSDTSNDDFQIKVDDPRFSALYSSPQFNIDPSELHYKHTQGMEALLHAKQKKINVNPDLYELNKTQTDKLTDDGINQLVSCIKLKSKKIRRKNM